MSKQNRSPFSQLPSRGAAHAQTLILGNKLELNTLDPHFFASFAPNSSLQYFFDKLTEYDDKPGAARARRLVEAPRRHHVGIQARPGVKFHDGTPFTADDVIFTIERVPNVPNSPNSAQFTRGIESGRRWTTTRSW
jgi:peptide/nickel transport system substrate-binding protein